MEILVGKTAGFCYGVKRAVDGAKKEINEGKNKLYCLGEIVHNKQVIEELEKQGIIFVDNICKVKNKAIIRAHGVEKDVYDTAKKNNIEIKDYTCPNVLKIHEIVNEYSRNGYYIFLCGSKKHPENIGTISYCNNKYSVIENENDVESGIKKFNETDSKKLLIISQTTYSLEKFAKIENIIRDRIDEKTELIIKNTICKATEIRQKETFELSNKVDYMIIIGGKNSSNTRKLYEIAKQNCKNSISIETEKEIDLRKLDKTSKIGIMAGASTPKESIEKVYEKINSLNLKY